ncbi:hypothetical protein [Spiroplasma endosymbiont of Ammophila pubescens]|uniref:hypothetical protein n=1 Tax=Spiroplasma endosymbiont of Ammophila pubescens TaxID=3066315 RepID=UPI0032B12902
MNNANKKIALISDYFNLYLITLFIFFIKPQLFSYYREIKLTEFIIKLIKYDNAVLNSRTFNIKNIDDLIVDVRLPVNATLNRQLNNNETIINIPNEEQGEQK